MPVAKVVSSGPSGNRRQRAIRLLGMSLNSNAPPRHTGPSVKTSPPATRSMGASGATRSCKARSRTSMGVMAVHDSAISVGHAPEIVDALREDLGDPQRDVEERLDVDGFPPGDSAHVAITLGVAGSEDLDALRGAVNQPILGDPGRCVESELRRSV